MIEIGNSLTPEWIELGQLNQYRHDCPIATLLAVGSLIVIGGNETLIPEMLDYSDPNPENWTWSELPAMEVPRKYHSTGLLLPDGRVWVGGSRMYPEPMRYEFENDMERRIEFYNPGYLFEGYRPEIVSAPLTIRYEDSYFEVEYNFVTVDITIESVVLISLASVTHCIDSNQRYLILDQSTVSAGLLRVTPPVDDYIAPLGYYMLIILRTKSESASGSVSIPSVAKIVRLVHA